MNIKAWYLLSLARLFRRFIYLETCKLFMNFFYGLDENRWKIFSLFSSSPGDEARKERKIREEITKLKSEARRRKELGSSGIYLATIIGSSFAISRFHLVLNCWDVTRRFDSPNLVSSLSAENFPPFFLLLIPFTESQERREKLKFFDLYPKSWRWHW